MAARNRRFHVVQILDDGSRQYIRKNARSDIAIRLFERYSASPLAKTGVAQRVMIVDSKEKPRVEWEFGQGVRYPA